MSSCVNMPPRASLARRRFFKQAACAALAVPFVLRNRYQVFADSPREYSDRVVRLVRESLVIDMLNQFLYRSDRQDLLKDWLSRATAFKQADFDQFRSSGVNAANFGDGADSLGEARDLFNSWNGFILNHPQWLVRIDSVADIDAARAQGRYGILYGLQSSGQFEDLDAVETCYSLGQRISQLSYNRRTAVGDGAFEPHDAGLSEYGAQVIAKMNAVGMAVDLGHASERTKFDACEVSKVPLILSHGNCRALIPDGPRSSTDAAIRALARRGGVMGITCICVMVKGSEPVTIEDVVDHYDHVRDLVGIEHVGIGSDAGIESNDVAGPKAVTDIMAKLDPRYHMHGTREVPPGMEGPGRVFELTAALVRRGYTDEHVRLVLGGNWRRVLAGIWRA